jgi:hypothetical protein
MSRGNELAQRKPKWWMVGVSEGDVLLPKQHASTMVEHVSDDVVFMMNGGQLRERKKTHIQAKHGRPGV